VVGPHPGEKESNMKKLLLLIGLAAAGAFVMMKRKQAAAAEQALWDEATGNAPATSSTN
jgi:hypothetical protein